LAAQGGVRSGAERFTDNAGSVRPGVVIFRRVN
jgi:hypothetical protein